MFVVLKLADFEFEAKNFLVPFIPISVDKGKMVGFLPVYATKEDALDEYPNSKLVEVREVKK